MTKFWKGVVLSLVVGVGLSLGGNAYSIYIWPANLKAQAEANALEDVRLEQERERIAQRERELAQRERLLALEVKRIEAVEKSALATSDLARRVGQLYEQVKLDRELLEAQRGANQRNRENGY